MSEVNFNVSSESTSAAAPVQPSSADPSIAGNVAQASKTSKKDYEMSTQVSSLNELKEKAPEVYKKMMEGIAYSIIGRMRKAQEHLKEMWRESRERR
jgi:hypothetical protein